MKLATVMATMLTLSCLLLALSFIVPTASAHEGLDNVLVIPGEYDVGEEITFNISRNVKLAEEAAGENITWVEWDFDYSKGSNGVLIFNREAEGEVVTHTYLKPGIYTLAIRRTHGDAKYDFETKQIRIRGPDLTIGMEPKVKPSRGIEEGDKITFTINVSNIGDLGAENITIRGYWEQVDDKHFFDEEVIPRLEAGQSVNVTLVWWEAESSENKTKIFILVDPDNVIREMNETNNQWDMKVQIEPIVDSFLVVAILFGVILVLIIGYLLFQHFRKDKPPKMSVEEARRIEDEKAKKRGQFFIDLVRGRPDEPVKRKGKKK